MKKLKYFLFHNVGYRIEELIYDFGCKPYKGYILYYEWSLFGIRGTETVAICCDKKSLEKELTIRDLKYDSVPKYKS